MSNFCFALFAVLVLAAPAPGATADEVFRGVSDSLDSDPPASTGAVLCLLAGAAGVAVVVHHRRRGRGGRADSRAATPARKPSPRRALREATRACGLRRREVRHLRRLAAERGWATPAVGLLCPSLLDAACRTAGRADRRVIAEVARKVRGL